MGEISKKTLAVLLLVAIVLSAVATWKMLSSESIVVISEDNTESTSHISFGIAGDEQPPEPVIETGKVAITIE